jgi:hypothetical protein
VNSLLKYTVWHADVTDPEEWKYRTMRRIWLPIFDLMAIVASIWAILHGSPILNKLIQNDVAVNVLGGVMFITSLVCLVAVIMPALWKVEIVAKIVLMSLLAGYATAILLMNQPPDWFPVFIISMTLPLPFLRLSVLGEEIKERRVLGGADTTRGE